MFEKLEEINSRPLPFQYYTAEELWTDEHTSAQMLSYHLNGDIDLSSRNTEFIERSVEWIVSQFNISSDSSIADFGCGPGLYASRLAQHGARVTGIDFSRRSIEYARELARNEGLKIDYTVANYLDFESDSRFDLIIMIFCDFCALSPDQRKTMLHKFRKLLTPGGYVLLDVNSLNAFDAREEIAIYEKNQLNGFWSPDTYYGFLNTFKYDDVKVVLDKYTIVEESRTRTVYNWLQHFSTEELTKEFIESGLAVDMLLSDVAGSPYSEESKEIAVIAKKAVNM